MKIHKKNETYIYIECERSISKHLSDYFSFYTSDYYFNPKFKSKQWDGKIRLYNLKTSQIYVGLFKKILKFAKDFEYEITYIDPALYPPSTDVREIEEFIDQLTFYSKSNKCFLKIHDYQKEAIIYCIKDPRTLLLSPTSSGKSLMIYSLVRWYQRTVKKKILIIVPSTSLVEQFYDDFEDYSYKEKDWKVEDNIHRIYSGKDKSSTKQIFISTWQSIYKEPLSFFNQFEKLIVDEAHGATAASLKQIAEKSINCASRIGTTGTIKDTTTHKLVLEGIFGPIHKLITTKDLIDMNHISNLTINVIILQYSKETKQQLFKSINDKSKGSKKASEKYHSEIEFLITNEKRNNFISKLAVHNKDNTLIMFNRIKHGEELFRLIDALDSGQETFFVAGKTKTTEREIIKKKTFKNNNLNIVASTVFSTGVNMPNLQYYIGAHPSKSEIRILQSIGRLLRKDGKENHAQIYDIADDLRRFIPDKKNPGKTKVSWENYSYKHARERIRLYKQQKFNYKIIKIQVD